MIKSVHVHILMYCGGDEERVKKMIDNIMFASISIITWFFGWGYDLDIESTQKIYTISLSSAVILLNNNIPDILDFVKGLIK